MRLDDLNWFDVESYLLSDDRLMLVLGSCEQHAYLSLLTDVKIPLAMAEAASERSGVLLAPPVNFGCSSYFMAYPGTFSLRVSTLMDLVEDLLRSAYRHRFRRILLMNGHGGNDPVRGRIFEIASELPDLHLVWYTWWQTHSFEQIVQKNELKPGHANWMEAFPFTRVSELPEEVKKPPKVPGMLGAHEARQVYGDGSFGGAYQVDTGIMDQVFEACVRDVLQLLRFG